MNYPICPFCSEPVDSNTTYERNFRCEHGENYFAFRYSDKSLTKVLQFTVATEIDGIKYRLVSYFEPYLDTLLYCRDLKDEYGVRTAPIIFNWPTPFFKNTKEIEHQITRLINLKTFL